MQEPAAFYHAQIEKYRSQLNAAARKLGFSSLLRLLVFLAIVFAVYAFWGNTTAVVATVLAGIIIFVLLVTRHSDLRYERDKFRELIKINETELQVLKRDFQHLPTGSEFSDPQHPYSQDVDLFGKASFFQYLNRTSLAEGKEKLARLLLSNNIDNIHLKQEAVKESAEKADWRQNFSALATLVKTETRTATITGWLNGYKHFVPGFMKWLPWVFSGISGVVIAAFFLDLIGGIELALWFFAGLLITGFFLKRINLLSSSVSKVQDTFHQYYQLLGLIENTTFSSQLLKVQREQIISEKNKASAILKQFSKAIDSLDQRNNMIFGVFGNGFLLWDLRYSYKLEQWIKDHGQVVPKWFEVIEFLDAYNSLGNFAFNHPNYVFPELHHDSHIAKATSLAHPLLDPEKRVANDFAIEKEQFFIITGANMAGKSTFLRTVSLQILMGNVGLPVCATSCHYTPIKLITSMRTTDSLTDDESYFFSELKRLKFVVDEIKTDKYFIILDEILKGTNSTDKAIGSRKFIEKLVGSQSTGIIATHDLSLCEVSEELPQVKNYYFDAEIINDELNFDYLFKKGICQNMNASFLLKKMEIVD
ncbi:DNA mismatch repair protein MutS [Salinimicrobium tongyeongense]|uniref:DNA mismatch repair protein MutS n=1 Tax=Salinimicrobium tongyeongense TaxID=2809707 RepID=A0ABY6NWH0_9FLAO|nr:DNA mismatch repair protein MutS [Salinimicrobium tongyeongense]UZH56818.1 DNA mismatch repair protein MutS [Salinimicrobium tongyeongense]